MHSNSWLSAIAVYSLEASSGGGKSRDAVQGAVAEIPLVDDADLNEASALLSKIDFMPGQRFVDGPRAGFDRKRKKPKMAGFPPGIYRSTGGICLRLRPDVGTGGSSL